MCIILVNIKSRIIFLKFIIKIINVPVISSNIINNNDYNKVINF